jgi:hypothetical protein
MLDLAIGTESKNYSLRQGPNPRTVWECMKLLMPVVAVACAFSFHLWVRGQNVQLGYQSYRLESQISKLLNEQRQLMAAAQTGKDRELRDAIAGNDIRLIILATQPSRTRQGSPLDGGPGGEPPDHKPTS